MTQVIARPRKSTIVRMFSAPVPVRFAFRLLDRVAPGIGARWAERIWFTLPRPRPDVRPSRPSGTIVPRTPFALTVDGRAVVGEAWGAGPTIYLMHGWAGHRRQLTAFVAPLVTRGHKVVPFDLPSHGESDPGRFGPRSSSVVEFTNTLVRVTA